MTSRRCLIGFDTGNHFVLFEFGFYPVGVDSIHRLLDRVQISLFKDRHQIAFAYKMFIETVFHHDLKVLAYLILPHFTEEEGYKHDVTKQQCSDYYGNYTNHNFLSNICLTGSISRSISPAPTINTTSNVSASFSTRSSSSLLRISFLAGMVTASNMISEVTPGIGSSRAG